MALIDRVKERTGAELSDTELTAMIAGISAEIDGRYGPAGPIELTMGDPQDRARWRRTLMLPRPLDPAEPVSVVEIEPSNRGAASAELVLADADYRVLHGGRTLQRLSDGPHGQVYWAPFVRISFSPLGDQAARDELVIKIMQLDLSYRGGLKSERAGDYQFTLGADAATEREKLLGSLSTGNRVTMA